jgi:hypothetical protein
MNVTKLVLLLILLFSVACHRTDKEKIEDKEFNKEIQILKQAVSDMVKKHNAITDWDKNLDTYSPYTYTIQVEDALIRSDNRPILFFGRVNDIAKKANKYFIHFSMISHNIYFVLECNEEQVKKILNKQDIHFYAFIALISSIQRTEFKEQAPDFIAKGVCMDFLPARYHLDASHYLPSSPPKPKKEDERGYKLNWPSFLGGSK